MMQQAVDFRDESAELNRVLAPLAESEYARPTLFKQWTIDDVLAHLHFWNYAADLSLSDVERFNALLTEMLTAWAGPDGHLAFTHRWLEGLSGTALRDNWFEYVEGMAVRFGAVDADTRVPWAGPPMTASTSIAARQMETWAHGQAVYDLLGVAAPETDRLRNIALLGVKTFGWTYANRKLPVPSTKPYVRLAAPSGEWWEWNDPTSEDRVEGPALDFCKVVTQTRNVADTELVVTGAIAGEWMSMAQCFAGPVEDPPAPGARRVAAG